MLRITPRAFTLPITSNISYALPLGVGVFLVPVLVVMVGVASALFHWYEYSVKLEDGRYRVGWWFDWMKSPGPLWQRVDMRLIYVTFASIFGYALAIMASVFVGVVLALALIGVCVFIDLKEYGRNSAVFSSAILATGTLLFLSPWLALLSAALFIGGFWLREEAYELPEINRLWHSLWHIITAGGWTVQAYILKSNAPASWMI